MVLLLELDQQNNNNSILGKLKNFINRISNTLLDTNLFKGYNEKLLKEYSTKLKSSSFKYRYYKEYR